MTRSLLRYSVLLLAATIAAGGCTAVPSTMGTSSTAPSNSAQPVALASASDRCPVAPRTLVATLNQFYTAAAPIGLADAPSPSIGAGEAKVMPDGRANEVRFASSDATGTESPISPRSVVATLSARGDSVPVRVTLRGDSALLALPAVIVEPNLLTLELTLDAAPCPDAAVSVSYHLNVVALSTPTPIPDCSGPQQWLAANLHGIYGDVWQALAPIAVAGTPLDPMEPDSGEPTRGFVTPRFYALDFGLSDESQGGGVATFAPHSVVATLASEDGTWPVEVKLDGTSAVLHLPAVTGHAVLTLDVTLHTATCRNGIARTAYQMDLVGADTAGACVPGQGPASVEVPRSDSYGVLFGSQPIGLWTVNAAARYGYWSEGDLVYPMAAFDGLGPAIQETAGSHLTIRPVVPVDALSVGYAAPDAFHWDAIVGPDGKLIDGGDSAPYLALPIKAGASGSLDLTLPATPGEYGILVQLGWSSPCLDGQAYLSARVVVR